MVDRERRRLVRATLRPSLLHDERSPDARYLQGGEPRAVLPQAIRPRDRSLPRLGGDLLRLESLVSRRIIELARRGPRADRGPRLRAFLVHLRPARALPRRSDSARVRASGEPGTADLFPGTVDRKRLAVSGARAIHRHPGRDRFG